MNTSPKIDTTFWDSRRNKITSSAGMWIGGRHVKVRNRDLFEELMGQKTYMQLLILNATGRMVNKNIADWIEVNFAGLSYPDARIWCNQIAAIAATSGTTIPAATIAGTLASDSRAYGPRTNVFSINFLKKAMEHKNKRRPLSEFIEAQPKLHGRPDISGFARPVDREDERTGPYRRLMAKFEIKEGKYLQLALEIDKYLYDNYGSGINSGGFASAFFADQGFTAEQTYNIKSLSVASGVLACAVDNQNAPANSFLPLRCDDIDYQGVKARELP